MRQFVQFRLTPRLHMTGLPSRGVRIALIGIAAALLLAPPHSRAQEEITIPSVTDTYALEGVRVVQAPGQVLESATVVVEDGIIAGVGSDVEIPYDADRIEGDSLVVYAGFIDGLSHAGVDTPDPEGDRSEIEDPGNPPPDMAGIQPDRSVRPLLTPSDSDLPKLRKAGFAAGHVVPDGQMLPGSGAYVFYGGDSPDDMVIETNQSLFAQIEGSPQYVYPATEMAVIAQMRQLYREAARRQELQMTYERNPVGMAQPPEDPIHSAFFPVLDGETPVAYYADDALSIHRVLALQNELGFPLMLSGLAQGHETVSSLQNIDVPLFLTTELPEEPERAADEDTTVADTTMNPGEYYDPDLRTPTQETMDDEEINLNLRHSMERQRYLETAATLDDAGIEFGFTTREADPGDIRANLRTMIENGLSEQSALAALTTRPASLLGLSNRLGTVEEGKIANLVVTKGPYFEEDSKVQHVLVDGEFYDYSSETDEGEVSGDVSAVLGEWSFTAETPQGEMTGSFTIEGDESSLSGTFVGPTGQEQNIQSVSFDGSKLSFSVASPQGTVTVSVTVQGDTFDGSVSGEFGSFPISGQRESGPGN